MPDLLPISALQHLLFCERQCALIHIERLWAENRLTAEGRVLHEAAHTPGHEQRPGIRVARGLALRSERLGIQGIADIVEFQAGGFILPVEYKRGRPKKDQSDAVQLCAQALCLEEMFGVGIPAGCLYYGQNRRRTEVVFTGPLRATTEQAAARLRELIDSRRTPLAERLPKCDSCSLLELCMPGALRLQRGVAAWNQRQSEAALALTLENLPAEDGALA